MTMYEILELIKIAGWTTIAGLAIFRKKKISTNTFWLSIISSVLMISSGADDLVNNQFLHEKSFLWFVGNMSIIATYLNMIRNSLRFYDGLKVHLAEFIDKVHKDRKAITKMGNKK